MAKTTKSKTSKKPRETARDALSIIDDMTAAASRLRGLAVAGEIVSHDLGSPMYQWACGELFLAMQDIAGEFSRLADEAQRRMLQE